ncbi:MAG: GxxExxY protein [Phycisphaerae bacterium]|nr:GxxExxY protein [Phycisphaerae bacterium]
MESEELTRKIIGCAYKVYNSMGFGFLESVYEKCLMIEPDNAGLKVESRKSIAVACNGQNVGDFVADLIVKNRVIVELKSVARLVKAHEVQLVNYLVATGFDVGLLVNFGETKVEVKRKVRKLTDRENKVDF